MHSGAGREVDDGELVLGAVEANAPLVSSATAAGAGTVQILVQRLWRIASATATAAES